MVSRSTVVCVAAVAVVVGVVLNMAAHTHIAGPPPGCDAGAATPAEARGRCAAAAKELGLEPRWMLGASGYDFKPIDAPIASGFMLRFVSDLLTRSPLGRLVRRRMLDANDVVLLRELAAQADGGVYPNMFRPVRRLTADEHARHVSLAGGSRNGDFSAELATDTTLPRTQPAGNQLYWEVADYAAAYQAGTLTPSEAMRRVLAGIREVDPQIKAFMASHDDDVMEQAAASDARWAAGSPLSIFDGVPIAVKDMIDVKGYHTTSGTLVPPGSPPASGDDEMVARFRDIGAIIVGTTMMTEFGVSPLGFNSRYNGTYNPYDTRYFSGGSSSGSAAAVAAGLVPVAIGFDGGGSIRIPAAVSGVYGLMAGFWRLPVTQAHTVASTVVHGGPLAATARDMALAYAVMSPNNPAHQFTQWYGSNGGLPPPHLAGFSDTKDLKGLRLGVYKEYFEDAPAASVAACRAALDFLVSRGAVVVPIEIPNLQGLNLAHSFSISAEFSQNEDWRFSNDASLGMPMEPHTRIQLALGHSMKATEYMASQRLKSWGFAQLTRLFKDEVDVIVTPTVAAATPALTEDMQASGLSDTGLIVRFTRFIFLGNLLGFPGVSVPVGYGPGELDLKADPAATDGDLPIGFHMMGDHFEEATLLRLSAALEDGFAGARRKRPQHFFDVHLDQGGEL